MTNFSFEFFPPRTASCADDLNKVAKKLADTQPDFMTVTYGAGGSSQDGSFQTLQAFSKACGNAVPLGSHLTYIASSKSKIEAYVEDLWANGVRHIVALRGDAPKTMTKEEAFAKSVFAYTSDFVTWLKQKYPFEISVGAYPEKHPDAPDLTADIEALRLKCDAGADRALTQFFFDNSIYYRFLDAALDKGIKTPILPGVLPIMNFGGMVNFAKKCESSIPPLLIERFGKYEDGSPDALKEAADFLNEQVDDLIAHGVEHIHFYSMNSDKILPSLCHRLKAQKSAVVVSKAPKYNCK
jgi:methylenetetrahydrofolate reductase (NADPH)